MKMWQSGRVANWQSGALVRRLLTSPLCHFATRPLLCLVLFMLIAAPAHAHPKPGAHADVRISIEDDTVTVTAVMNILFAEQVVNVPRKAIDNVTDDEIPPLKAAMIEYFGGGRAADVTALVDRPNSVKIDGVDVPPIIREVQIVRPEPETRPGFIQNPVLLIPRIQVIAEYPCKSPPKTVALVWGSYPRDFTAAVNGLAPITDIEAVLTHGELMDLITFRKSEPEYTWHAPAKGGKRFVDIPARPQTTATWSTGVPIGSVAVAALWIIGAGVLVTRSKAGVLSVPMLVSLIIAGVLGVMLWPVKSLRLGSTPPPPRLSENDALAIFTPLHANIYRAFDYTRESAVYDALAQSVDGPMLDTIYTEVYNGLVMREEGGALSRVRSVTPIETLVLPPREPAPPGVSPDQFTVKCRWRVLGVVYHWGHSHSRTSEYLAEYDVAPRPTQPVTHGSQAGSQADTPQTTAAWRIVAMRPLEQRRIEGDIQAKSDASVNTPQSTPQNTPANTPANTKPAEDIAP